MPSPAIGLTTALPLREQAAQLFEVGLGVALAQVDGEVRDPAGVVGVAAQRAGPQRAAHPVEDLGRGGLDGGADAQGQPVGVGLRVGVDPGGRLVENGPRGAEGDVDRAEVGQGVRAGVLAAGRRQQGVGHPEGTTEPAGRDAYAAVPEAGAVDVRAGVADRPGRRVGEADRAAVAAGHADRRPGAVERGRVRVLGADREQPDAVVGGRRHQCIGAPGRARAPRTVAGETPAVGAVLRAYRRRRRRPDPQRSPERF
ncbi:hypothetical protein [Paractinoplanes durhamensis]|uniref:hypothetical protein n=1 Tax=Paractinoplanes durhamensis TaxID=113563 RepID=UPI00363DC247